jgi:hypothetical protein
MTPDAEATFSRRLEDYMVARGLQLVGAPLRAVVWSPDRSLTATDQVDLLDWLIDDPAVQAAMVSPLGRQLGQPAHRDDGYIRVCSTDMALIGLTLLYRARRVGAELYLQILGGYLRPVVAQP